jgi:hypothetical protein
MTKREIAFLLIGFGIGLPFAMIGAATLVTVWMHHMFIMGISWGPGSVFLVVPFLPLIVGLILLYRNRSQA